jgi:nucleotide-binding universal stress UspA family protein
MAPILVALDASPRAPTVLSTARACAIAMRRELVAVRAVGIPREIPDEVLSLPPDKAEEAFLAIAQREVAELLRTPGAGPHEKTMGVAGVAWDAICRAARDRGAGLIVLGSHGFSGLDRILGTTAARVVNHAPCSVLIVREPPPWPLTRKRIVVGLDDSPRAARVLETAVGLADGAELEVVRVAHLPRDIPRGIDTSQATVDQLLTAEKESVAELVSKAPEGLVITPHIAEGVPWKVLCARVEDEAADLIVVGTHGYEGLDRVLGTTAARVVDRASCSVFVVR